jgi:hypothetical protein
MSGWRLAVGAWLREAVEDAVLVCDAMYEIRLEAGDDESSCQPPTANR